MHYYLKIAKIGFVITAQIGCFFMAAASLVVPEAQRLLPLSTYFVLSGAYVVCLPAILHDMFMKQRIWADHRVRCLGIPLVGASVGLFLLGWSAIVEPTGLVEWRITEYNLLDRGLENIGTEGHQLICQAELLATCKLFVDNCGKYASAFAAVAMLGTWLYDKVKPRWPVVSFLLGLLLPLPLIIPFLIDKYTGELTTLSGITFLTNAWLLMGSILGIFLIAVVWTVRDGWWQAMETV